MEKPIKIPISRAKDIGKDLNYQQVIIVAWNKNGTTHITTWGKTDQDSEQAAMGGEFIKKSLGWPDSLISTGSVPERIKKRHAVFLDWCGSNFEFTPTGWEEKYIENGKVFSSLELWEIWEQLGMPGLK